MNNRRYTRYNQTPTETETNTAWFKSPLILGILTVASIIIGSTLWADATTPKVNHIRADDNSDSAVKFAEQRKRHCELSVQHYKTGDTSTYLAYADRPVMVKKVPILNSLSLLGECQHEDRQISNKQPGTSLISLLERIEANVTKTKVRGNDNPFVITITLQSTEPVSHKTLDLEKVKQSIENLAKQNSYIALMIDDETLQNQLDIELASQANNVEICSLNDVQTCVDWAFSQGRIKN